MRTSFLVFGLLFVMTGHAAFANGSSSQCLGPQALNLPDTEIVSARIYDEQSVDDPALPAAPITVPTHCRVRGFIRPASGSEIEFEVWMPENDWNGKLMGVGNGGYAGHIFHQGGLAEAIQRGYAAVTSDGGHKAGAVDSSWAYQNPEKIIDWGHRSIHLMTVVAKKIIKARFGRDIERSYYSSCSNGGRQGLMEAQRYPEDYDGIVVGAPAYDFTGLMTAFIWNGLAQTATPQSAIPASMVDPISKAVLKQCDALDGIKDGLVSNPRACKFGPDVLRCTADQTSDCLSTPQITALKTIYAGAKTSDGKQIYPGWRPGGEPGTRPETGWRTGWNAWIFGKDAYQPQYGEGYFQNVVGYGPDWSMDRIDFDQDPGTAREKVGSIVNAINPDLSEFANRGGKLIIYHGWSDPAISAESSIQYYAAVQKTMGVDRAKEFVRLFLVPGMGHCMAGHGPNLFNNLTAPVSPKDPNRDISAALEHWVENGEAPKKLIAVDPENFNESMYDYTKAIPIRTGLLCPYPKMAQLKNKSLDPDKAENYTCGK